MTGRPNIVFITADQQRADCFGFEGRKVKTPHLDRMEVMEAAAGWDRTLEERGYEAMPINGAAVAGRVVAATLGNEERLEFTVIGAAANLAAKLEKHNKVAETRALTDEET